MVTDLEKRTRELLDAYSALEFDTVQDMMVDDPQGVDEISGSWIRGRDAMVGYFDQLRAAGMSDVQSEIRDVDVREFGDIGIVTCMVDQSYILGGERSKVTAPTTVVFSRDGDEWKVVLVNAVSLPQ